jgi:molybdopterin converting factor small subunit
MPRVILTGSIRQQAGGLGVVEAGGATAAAVVRSLEASCPGLRGWVVDERGALRRHVRLFLGGQAVSLEAPIGPDDELHIVGAISGG